MTSEDKKVYDEFGVLKTDMGELRKSLSELNEQKEHWFSEKEKCSTEIREKIKLVKEAKEKRDSLTQSVKQKKEERTTIDKDLAELSKKLDSLKEERQKIYAKHNLKGSPGQIRKTIESLETKIEVEVVSFDKEKKIMKEIKALKTQLKEFDVADEINKQVSLLSAEFREKQKESNRIAKSVREEAAKSQVEHNLMISISKEIDELKKKEEECFKKFSELKEQYNQINRQFKEKSEEMDTVKGTIKDKKEQKKKENAVKQKEALDKMKGKVDEKLKKGLKLTTEDLKIFQDGM